MTDNKPMGHLTLQGLSSAIVKGGAEEAWRLFDSAPAREQALLLREYRLTVDEKRGTSAPLRRFFHKIVDYTPSHDPMARIRQTLEQLKARYQNTTPVPSGSPRLVSYCKDGRGGDEGKNWQEAAFLERQKVALQLLLQDLDSAHQKDLADTRHLQARSLIDGAFRTFYDPVRSDTDGDGKLDCSDTHPLDRKEFGWFQNPEHYLDTFRPRFRRVPGKHLYSKDLPIFLEDRGGSQPIAIVVPILLLPVEPGVDVTTIVKQKGQIEKLLNEKLMPTLWRRYFKIEIRFATDPEAAIAELLKTPYQVVRVNRAPAAEVRTHAMNWSIADSLETLAHETGHLLGWPDRYSEPLTPREHTFDPGWHFWSEGDLMGEGGADYISLVDLRWTLAGFLENEKRGENSYAGPSVEARIRREAVQAASWRGDIQTVERLSYGREDAEPVFYFYQGHCYENKDPQRALALYQKAFERGHVLFDPNDFVGWRWFGAIGEFLSKQGDVPRAVAFVKQCCPRFEFHPAGCYYLWRWKVISDAAARGRLKELLKSNPASPLHHHYMGRFEMDHGNLKKAAAHFKEALSLSNGGQSWEAVHMDPGPGQFALYGDLFKRVGDLEGAATSYANGLLVNPQDSKLEGKLTALLADSNETVPPQQLLNLATTFAESGNHPLAHRLLRQIQKNPPPSDLLQRVLEGDEFAEVALGNWGRYAPLLREDFLDLSFRDRGLEEEFRRRLLARYPEVDSNRFTLAILLGHRGVQENDRALIHEALDLYATLDTPSLKIVPLLESFSRGQDLPIIDLFYQELKQRDWLNPRSSSLFLDEAIDEGDDSLVDSLFVDMVERGVFASNDSEESGASRALLYSRLYDYYSGRRDDEKINELVRLWFGNPVYAEYSNSKGSSILGDFKEEIKQQAPRYQRTIDETLRLDSTGIPLQVSILLREVTTQRDQGRFDLAHRALARAEERLGVFRAFVHEFGPPDGVPEKEALIDALLVARGHLGVARLELEIREKGESMDRYLSLAWNYSRLGKYTRDQKWIRKQAEACREAYWLLGPETSESTERDLVTTLVRVHKEMGHQKRAREWQALLP